MRNASIILSRIRRYEEQEAMRIKRFLSDAPSLPPVELTSDQRTQLALEYIFKHKKHAPRKRTKKAAGRVRN